MCCRAVPVGFLKSVLRQAIPSIEIWLEIGTGPFVPTCMNNTKTWELEPNRELPKPSNGILIFLRPLIELAQKLQMLARILFGALPQISALTIRRRPGDCIELMVSEHGMSRAS